VTRRHDSQQQIKNNKCMIWWPNDSVIKGVKGDNSSVMDEIGPSNWTLTIIELKL